MRIDKAQPLLGRAYGAPGSSGGNVPGGRALRCSQGILRVCLAFCGRWQLLVQMSSQRCIRESSYVIVVPICGKGSMSTPVIFKSLQKWSMSGKIVFEWPLYMFH